MSTEADLRPDMRIDVRGTCCPLPLIEITKAASRLLPGQMLEIIGNDPVFESAVRNFCESHGHALLHVAPLPDQSVCMRIEIGTRAHAK